ncbi:MAG: helicase-exonuclease AddAB subunit AddA [Hungatella sp.]|nr:helicase-exonuclease AddAB subunit AddA [Hungatella sp.]
MNWTEKQKQVIDARNRSLLVSAAAGSGKTAVLVERIVQLISEGENPLDIDQLLVMTFTNAAAAEMRERVSIAIEKKLKENPESLHLQAQAALVPYAQITTIDSFCLNLIRNHFNLLDVDPAFRIGDEGELILIRADVMEDMLEEYYEKEDLEFQRFVDTYATGKSDGGIEDYIMQVYTFAQSNPFPDGWIQSCREELGQMEDGDLGESRWMKYLMRDVRLQLGELAEQLEQAMEICREPGGPEVYLANLQQEYELLCGLLRAADYEEFSRRLGGAAFGRLAAARSKDIDPEKKSAVTGCRDRVKKAVGSLKEQYGMQTQKEAAEDMLRTKGVVLKLLELAEEFSRRYQEMKRDKNIVDFNDLEHYALDILVKREETGPEDSQEGRKENSVMEGEHLFYTETADELSRQYAEILVDEYQDSNYVQETLIQGLSGERFGRPNVFMVGDVKQSIYKFRLARPELFMEKYETYTTEESGHQKIELHQNFRSRASVLNSVNSIFYQIMTKNLGNVEYTKEAALHPGAVFEEYEESDGNHFQIGTATELLLADTGKESMGQMDPDLADYTSREIEAKIIGAKIRELLNPVNGLAIWDKEKRCYRLAEYGDIVILLRSISGWSQAFINVLTKEGIPAYAETGTGYFDTIEVETVLAVLSVIDNPMQDIPLAAVLSSPVAGVTDEELAWMMSAYKRETNRGQDRGLYGAFWFWIGEEGQEESLPFPDLQRKLRNFQELLEDLRYQSSYLPIHELIYQVYDRTGYYDYVSAMPAGETRRANLDMLVEKAAVYEKTSYKGLFQFIRYIHKLKKYETDFGEASVSGKYENMVRIMSIHKSKGLEFPIVFLAGTGKLFNKQDIRGKLIIDSDLGIGTDYLDLELRTRTSTLKKNVLKRKMDLDNLGEELRVLYVAMTRAKEKLILTGTDRSLEKKMEKWTQVTGYEGLHNGLPYTVLTTASSYLDWILMTCPEKNPLFQVQEIPVESLVSTEVLRQIEKRVSKEELLTLDTETVYDEEMAGQLEKCLSYQYPYQADINLYTKMTVSELKRLGQEIDDFDGLYQPEVPEFLRGRGDFVEQQDSAEQQVPTEQRDSAEQQVPTEQQGSVKQQDSMESGLEKHRIEEAAKRGTAYHRILELLDFTAASTREDVKQQFHSLLASEKISEDSLKKVRQDTIWRFAASPLGRRIARAQKEGRCHREQQFVMGIPAEEIGAGDSRELVLIQGIIDAYLEEEDGLVLIDYKTDHILKGQEDVLIKRYRNQIDYYQRALEQIVGKNVKERIIYSLSLQKEVIV